MLDFPRYVGNPFQHYVQTERDFKNFLDFNNGKNDCYWSHNGHPSSDTIMVRTIPFDLDSKESLEGPYKDMQRLAALGRRVDTPVLSVFTTNKGFHSYLCFEPVLAENNTALKEYYKAVQSWAIEEAGLEYFDEQIYGDTRRIMRVPGTIHPKTGLWCCQVDPDSSLPDILAKSKNPQPVVTFPQGKEKFIDFCRRNHIKRERGMSINFTGTSFAPYNPKEGDFEKFLKTIIPRPCVHNALMTNNPPHNIRLEAVVTLMQNGYDMMFTINFMRKVSSHYSWVNRDPNIQNYHIGYIYQHPGYQVHRCARLREEGLCIGKNCDMFERAFPEDT